MTQRIRNRRYAFTCFSSEEHNILLSIKNGTEVGTEVVGNTKLQLLLLKTQYLIAGLEVCPSTKKEHYQCYIEFIKPEDISIFKKCEFKTAHIEPCKGTQEQNINYCKKEKNFFEYGNPKIAGKRNDLTSTALKIVQGTTVEELKEEAPEMIVKYHKGLQLLENMCTKPEIKEKKIKVHWGVAGSGKSHTVYSDNPIESIFKAKYGNSGVWFDGYNPKQHKTVLFDEFAGQIKLQNLLEYLDKYPVQVEYKGGMKYFQPDNIYICSNKHPKDWYNWENQNPEIQQALMRRLKGNVIKFETKYQGEKLNWNDL